MAVIGRCLAVATLIDESFKLSRIVNKDLS